MMISAQENAHSLAAAQLRVELARRQQLTMMVAHEMRNLLAPLAYGIELLARADSAATIVARPVIARQVAQMRRLVDDLLDVTCADQGRMSLRIASVDLREIVAAAIDVARPTIATREQHLTLADLTTGSSIIDGDPCRLTQVLSNLLINAAKFTPKCGHIEVMLEREISWMKVCVRDTGVGIAPELLPKIFDVYVHTPRESDGARDGLGLGLTVARNLVESHGGTLSAHSDGPGQGSEFVMRLPVAARC
jgi:signal transduction histidine kinase